MLAEYLPLVLLVAVASLFVGLSLFVLAYLGPHQPNPTKRAAYESGIIPQQTLTRLRTPGAGYPPQSPIAAPNRCGVAAALTAEWQIWRSCVPVNGNRREVAPRSAWRLRSAWGQVNRARRR